MSIQVNGRKTQWKGKFGIKNLVPSVPKVSFNFLNFLIKIILLLFIIVIFVRGFLFVDKFLTIKELELSIKKEVITKYIKDLNLPLEANVEILKNKIGELEARSIVKYIHQRRKVKTTIMNGKNKGKKIIR